uniref:Uncharacterized protein n=1 Tax=Arundo donax TaxID=35708 RepID=A0A0A8Z109_ARUDO
MCGEPRAIHFGLVVSGCVSLDCGGVFSISHSLCSWTCKSGWPEVSHWEF